MFIDLFFAHLPFNPLVKNTAACSCVESSTFLCWCLEEGVESSIVSHTGLTKDKENMTLFFTYMLLPR